MPQLDAGQRPVAVDASVMSGHVADIALVPQRGMRVGRVVGTRIDRAIFGINHAPAALGLYFAHGGERIGQEIAHAGAMRHLVEAVRRRDRPDPHRLEQDIVARIAQRPWLLDFAPIFTVYKALCNPTRCAATDNW